MVICCVWWRAGNMGVFSGIILTDFFLVHVFISFFLFPLRRRSPSFDQFERLHGVEHGVL